jgi:hypothetical protein
VTDSLTQLSHDKRKRTQDRELCSYRQNNYVLQFHSAYGLCNAETKPDDFNPIPLSEEWLKKFGFSKTEEYDKNVYRLKNVVIIEGDIIIGGDVFYYFRVRLDYVHKLQNLYFALTGTELTITP